MGKKKKVFTSKGMLICRMAVGAYLVYLSYGLIDDLTKKADEVSKIEHIGFMAAALIFAAIGVGFILFSIKALKNGEYVGGSADSSASGQEKEKTEQIKKEQRITFDETDEDMNGNKE